MVSSERLPRRQPAERWPGTNCSLGPLCKAPGEGWAGPACSATPSPRPGARRSRPATSRASSPGPARGVGEARCCVGGWPALVLWC
eukprot:2852881-Alexandrium_andersonii.AAC.1